MDCGKGYESGEGVGEVFVVLGEATVAAEPGKGSLDDPSTGQHDEAFRDVRALDDFEPEPRRSRDGVFDLVSVVARVGPDKLQPGKALADLVEVSAISAFETARGFHLVNDNGSIIFNGSVHNYLGQPGVAAYAATKGGLVSMARSIAADLAPRKIRVNVVAPGATKTPIWKRGPRANATAEESAKVSDWFSSTVPLARWGEPEDVAKAVLFLASDDSSYVNAVELMVDGGLTGAPFGAPILRG